jgi:serine/threonine protein phosphatase PrpC
VTCVSLLAFSVLHEIHDTKDRSILVLGVMDGHGGTAASTKVSTELPSMLSNQIVVNRTPLEEALLNSWNSICQSYQQQCANDDDQCVADYNALEGILMANTGSEDLIAGTTASMMALDETNGKLVALNCGDSRSMVVTPEGKVQLVTQDHTPETEEERLMEGVAAGLGYSLPKCKISKWTISAGAYEYAVGRSLEGPFVTSKGIVSDADISKTSIGPGEILVSASDGLWEVMDSDEVALDLYKMRKQGLNARDAARELCSMAFQKGTADNVSVVVVYV